MLSLLTQFCLQLLMTAGVIVVFGSLISLCRRGFCRLIGRNGPRILLATGIVGTPIHELSHALMCVVFGHKITDMELYQPNSSDGTLGYVSHTFRPHNLYHQIGNFFIGIAPILGGSGVILLLMRFLVPDTFFSVTGLLGTCMRGETLFSLSFFGEYLSTLWQIIRTIFDVSGFGNARFWIFFVLSLMILSHMELSGADIKGGVRGFFFLAGILLFADLVLFLVSETALRALTVAFMTFSLGIVGFLTISGVFSLILLLIALIVRVLR